MAPLCPFPLASFTKPQALLWIPLALGIKTKVLPRPWRPFLIRSLKTSPASSHTVSHIRPSSYPPFHQPWPCFTLFFAWNTPLFPLAFRYLIHTAFMALLKPHFFQEAIPDSQSRSDPTPQALEPPCFFLTVLLSAAKSQLLVLLAVVAWVLSLALWEVRCMRGGSESMFAQVCFPMWI